MEKSKINLKYLFSAHFIVWLVYHFAYGILTYYFRPGELFDIIEYRLVQLFLGFIIGSLIIIPLFYFTLKFSKNEVQRLAGFIVSIPVSIILYSFITDIYYYLTADDYVFYGFPRFLKSLTYYFYLFASLNALGYIYIYWQKYKKQKLENKTLLKNLNEKEEEEKEADTKIFLSSRHIPNHIDLSSIKYIHADAYLSHIVTDKNKKITLERSLKKWEDNLPENMFYRIHRSVIVNTEFISKIEKQPNQTYSVFIKECETPLSMSRRYGKDFISNPQFCDLF